MVEEGEMRHLKGERLWREMMAAMRTAQPWRFFEVLHRCGALQVLIPPLSAAMGELAAHADETDSAPVAALKRATAAGADASCRLAAALLACIDSTSAAEALMSQLRADRGTAQLLRRAAAGWPLYRAAGQGDVDALLELLGLWRGFDRDADLDAPLSVCEAQTAQPVAGRYLRLALPAARAVSAAGLREQGLVGAELGRQLALSRREAMHAALQAAGLLT
jgi:tRNA nucleotidyltransferase (CCA-adding enzyme)